MLKSANDPSDFDDGGGREAAADRPRSIGLRGSSCVVRDERMERGAPMSAAVVEGTDADDASQMRC